ncbi:MAG: RdgB/HAM1 family non-canonical purine NTP pyrophosphatase [Paludibacteraceae bacterium]|nr:RdgB/HAM1 family non-canonical purine NTP pyrophosphatase [Paludibacteraceae bacterium]
MKLVFASNNAHKLDEVRQIMPADVEVLSLSEIGFEQEIEETGETLEANSEIKARTVAAFIGERLKVKGERIDGVFADDTGLEIDALGGKPGVYTARWYRLNDGMSAAAPLNDEMMIFAANRAKALQELKGETDRGAQFRTVITLILVEREKTALLKEKRTIQVSGIVRGRIAEEEYGQGGFGYDPVFIPEGYDKTFGELPAEIKNSISHRSRALQALVKLLNS